MHSANIVNQVKIEKGGLRSTVGLMGKPVQDHPPKKKKKRKQKKRGDGEPRIDFFSGNPSMAFNPQGIKITAS